MQKIKLLFISLKSECGVYGVRSKSYGPSFIGEIINLYLYVRLMLTPLFRVTKAGKIYD